MLIVDEVDLKENVFEGIDPNVFQLSKFSKDYEIFWEFWKKYKSKVKVSVTQMSWTFWNG